MTEFVRSMPCEMERLSVLRHELNVWLGSLRADLGSRQAVVLATHEAAANAIEHGRCAGLEIKARVEEQEIQLEVRADGKWKPSLFDNEERGRGLLLIYGLMESVEIEKNEAGASVRMRLSYRRDDSDDQPLGI